MRVINFTEISTAVFCLHPAHLQNLLSALCDRLE